MKTLTEEQKQEIVRLYKLKILNKNIAQILGINKHSVANYIYKFYLVGVKERKYNCEHLLQSEKVLEMYHKGIPYKEIEAETGIKRHNMTEILFQTKHRRRKPLSIKVVSQIEEMVKQNKKIYQIVSALDLDYNKTQYWVTKFRKQSVH
jgi:transposase-like protein